MTLLILLLIPLRRIADPVSALHRTRTRCLFARADSVASMAAQGVLKVVSTVAIRKIHVRISLLDCIR